MTTLPAKAGSFSGHARANAPRFVLKVAITEETRRFRPHLLVRNDNAGVEPELLAEIPYWIEVLYGDSMNARISADGHVTEVQDIAMDDLLRLVDERGS